MRLIPVHLYPVGMTVKVLQCVQSLPGVTARNADVSIKNAIQRDFSESKYVLIRFCYFLRVEVRSWIPQPLQVGIWIRDSFQEVFQGFLEWLSLRFHH